jgi:peptidoglycan/xylan/chitin deacetylase (PgdA/CDA1 family)
MAASFSHRRFINIFRNEWYRYRTRIRNALFRKPLVLDLQKPIISFTFDDFYKSSYINGGKILRKFGVRGTYYLSMGLQNQNKNSGSLLSCDDLINLFRDGHEIGSHTFNHIHCSETPPADIKKDVMHNCQKLQEIFPDIKISNFAYPYGKFNLRSKYLFRNIFLSCRGTRTGINAGLIDLNLLKANPLYSNSIDFKHINGLIDENLKINGWLIFYTHDVQDKPSAFGCTCEHFSSAVESASASGAQILTIGEALRQIKASQNKPIMVVSPFMFVSYCLVPILRILALPT